MDDYYFKEPEPRKPSSWPSRCAMVIFIIILIL